MCIAHMPVLTDLLGFLLRRSQEGAVEDHLPIESERFDEGKLIETEEKNQLIFRLSVVVSLF